MGMDSGKENNQPPAISVTVAGYAAMWDGNDLWYRGRLVASVIPDGSYAGMWHIVTPDGTTSDMVNLARARDAAHSLAARSRYTLDA